MNASQDTEFKRTTIIFIKEFEAFKEGMKKQLGGIKEKELRENTNLSGAQEKKNVKQKGMTETTQELRMELNKKRT